MTILLLLFLFSLSWGIWNQIRIKRLKRRFKSVLEIDKYVESAEKEAKVKLQKLEAEAVSLRAKIDHELNELQYRIKQSEEEAIKARKEIENERSEIIDAAHKESAEIIHRAENESQLITATAQQELLRLEDSIKKIEQSRSLGQQELDRLQEEIKIAQDAAYLQEVGYYESRYEFEDIASYEKELSRIRDRQKSMLREDGTGNNKAGAAAYSTADLTFNGSTAQGRAAQKQIIKLMLRAFNGECDSFIGRVSYRNIGIMEKRMEVSFDAINAITSKYYSCVLNKQYLYVRNEELTLVYEYEEAKQQEKEEQARIREQIREEEKAARELERARKQAEQEEAKYAEMLRKAQEEAKAASQKDKAKLTKLNKTIAELQQRLEEAEKSKRTISQAELTKTGHVYIISNIGSFGENVFKIGMTRRLDPMDRVKELGDASVPFPFDVHAMIRTSNAPALENALHRHFEHRRMNLENNRKEFFRVSIDEIRQELHQIQEELGIESELRLTLMAEAKEYRMSEAKRRHWESESS